jgi:hypothetical protein
MDYITRGQPTARRGQLELGPAQSVTLSPSPSRQSRRRFLGRLQLGMQKREGLAGHSQVDLLLGVRRVGPQRGRPCCPGPSRVGPTPCPTLDNPPKAGGKRACAASRFCSVTPSLSSTVCAPTWLASSCTCHGLARLLTGDSANRGQADRARRHLPRQGGEARQLEGAGGKVLLQRRPALAQRMRQRLGVLARQPELLQLEGQRVNRHVVPSR